MRATRLSVANYNTTLSSESLETGTGSSNSLRSANESLRTNAGSGVRWIVLGRRENARCVKD